ncbi:MAG: hypothetical protein ABSA09_11895 [Desulfobaccales bacterium]
MRSRYKIVELEAPHFITCTIWPALILMAALHAGAALLPVARPAAAFPG